MSGNDSNFEKIKLSVFLFFIKDFHGYFNKNDYKMDITNYFSNAIIL